MKKLIFAFLLLAFSFSNLQADDWERTEEPKAPRSGLVQREGSAASHGSYEAANISMIVWGLLLIAGITTAAVLIENSTGTGTIH